MPVIRYHCSKCDYEFELTRPPSKATEYMACPKCDNRASPSSNFSRGSPVEHSESGSKIGALRELPPWAKGQVEAQVRQMISRGDTVAGQEVDLITQEILKELSDTGLEITPTSIKTLAQKHMSKLDSWAKIARRQGARLDAAAKLDDEE